MRRCLVALVFSLLATMLCGSTRAAPATEDAAQQAMRARGRLASTPVLKHLESAAGRGRRRETRLLKSDGHYPLIADEIIREEPKAGVKGEGRVLEYHSVVADHLIVQLRPGRNRAALAAACRRRGWSIRQEMPVKGFYLVAISQPGIEGLRAASEDFVANEDALVQTVEADELIWLDLTPNDPNFSRLYGLHNTGQSGGIADADIDAPEAWTRSTGSPQTVVAVIDSGVDLDHPDLAGNLWQNPGEAGLDGNGEDKRTNGVDDDSNGYVDDYQGWDFYNDDNQPDDDNGHGSHCAGTIGAVGNNGVGVAGVCWQVRIMPLKFSGSTGSGPTSAAVSAIQYAAARGVKILSCSWGSVNSSSSLSAAISAIEDSALFVAAAGNDGLDNDTTPHYPANYAYSNILSVAATDSGDKLAYFSDFGLTTVDLAAPGYYTYSCLTNGLYGYKSGTSMATPHVSGAAALLWSILPNAPVSRIRNALLAGVDPVSTLSGKMVSGGRLNVNNAIQQLASFGVSSCDPDEGVVLTERPTAITLRFTDAMLSTGLSASGLTVNGVAADKVEADGADGLIYTFDASPVSEEGVQNVSLAAGAVLRADDGVPAPAYASTFYYDGNPLAVSAVDPPVGTLTTIPTEVRLTFNEPVDPDSVSISDLELSAGTVHSATVVSSTVVLYGLQVPSLDGEWTVRLPAGAVSDSNGCPNPSAFGATFSLDLPIGEFAGPWSSLAPDGAQIYTNIVRGQILVSGDSDSFWLQLDAAQSISVGIQPDASLKPSIRLETASGTVLAEATSAAAGSAVALPAFTLSGTEDYVLSVSDAGTGTGAYVLTAYLNTTQEQEAFGGDDNGTADAAESLDSVWQTLPGTLFAKRASVVGNLEKEEDLTLYDVDFSDPPHKPGLAPVTGYGEAPRSTVCFPYPLGSPRVAGSVGPMTSPCLNLNLGDQTGFYVGTSGRFSTDYASYKLAFDAVIMPAVAGFTVYVDCPTVRTISFTSASTITVWMSPYTYTIGSYTPGQAFHMEVLVDQTADTLTVWKDGILLASKAGNGIEATRNFRFSTLYNDNEVGIDNVIVSTDDATMPVSEEDWYQIGLSGEAPLTVALNSADPHTLVELELLGSDGTSVLASGTSSEGNTAMLSGLSTPAGTVYLHVSGQASSYQLSVAEDICLEKEPNATRANASAAGNARVMCSRLGAPATADTQDWFAIDLQAGTPLMLTTATPGDGSRSPENTLDPALELFDSDGVQVAADTDGAVDGRNAKLRYVSSASGVFYVRAFVQSGAGDLEIRRSALPQISIRPSTNDVTEGLVDSIDCEIMLSLPRSEETTIALSSSDTRRLVVPATVELPSGGTNVSFTVQVVDEMWLNGPSDVYLTASAPECAEDSSVVRVHDNESTALTLSLPSSANENAGIVVGGGRLTLGDAVDEDVVFVLHSGDTSEMTVPDSVVVQAGSREVLFDLSLVDDVWLDGTQTVAVEASLSDWGSASAQIDVTDDERQALHLLPAAGGVLREGAGLISQAGLLTLDLAVTNNSTILLSSSSPSVVAPATSTVIIPAGSKNGAFGVVVADDVLCQGRRSVTLSATMSSGETTNAVYTVWDDDPHHLQFASISNTQESGTPFLVSLSYRTIDGDPLPGLGPREVVIASYGPAGLLTDQHIMLTNGCWSGEIVLQGSGGGFFLDAEDDAEIRGTSSAFSLISPILRISPDHITDVCLELGAQTQRECVITNSGPIPLSFRWQPSWPEWVGVAPTNGVVQPSSAVTVSVTFRTTGLQRNDEVASSLVLLSNDFNAPSNAIPLRLTVMGPDLKALATAPAGRLKMGESFLFSYGVTNAGMANAAFTIAGFYLSRDNVLDSADYAFDYMDYVSPLVSGAQTWRSTSLVMPDTAEWIGPNAYLLVRADALGLVDEGRLENNNVYSVPVVLTRDSGVFILAPAAATNVVVQSGAFVLKTFCISNAGLQTLEFSLEGLPALDYDGQSYDALTDETSTFWTIGATASSVPPFGSTQINVLFDAHARSPGFYGTATPVFTSNDPLCPALGLPLAMGVPAKPPVMVAEPVYTLGFSNRIAWTAMPGASGYESESTPHSPGTCATEDVSGLYDGLGNGVLYSYRVRSISSFPFGSVTSQWSAATESLQLHPNADYDGDGVPNDWEDEKGMSPVARADGLLDADADGFSGAEEYEADTDPNDHGSSLRFIGTASNAGGFNFTWCGGAAATQVLETSSELSSQAVWVPLFTNMPPTSLTNTISVPPPADETPVFLRLRAYR